jgi:hypothetical protein
MNRLRRHWPILGLVLVLLFVTVVRWRTRTVPLERDEGEYAYAGQLMLQGIPPYRWLYNFKLPGVYAAYAVIMAVFGQTPSGIHLGFWLVNLGAIVLMYRLGRRFLGPPASLAAAATFALLSLSQAVVGLAGHATQLLVLAALGGIVLLLRGQERGQLGTIFLGGALCGAAFLMKQPGGAFALLGLSLLAWSAWEEKPISWKKQGASVQLQKWFYNEPLSLPSPRKAGRGWPQAGRGDWVKVSLKHYTRMAVFCCGVLTPIALTACWLWQAGVWPKFWFWTVTYASVHATVETWSFGRDRLALFFAGLKWDVLLWLLAAAGLVCVFALSRGRKFFPTALLVLSAAAVCPAFYFSPHYFILLLPAIALLTGYALEAADKRTIPWILFVVCWSLIVFSRRDVFFEMTAEQISDRTYGRNDFEAYPAIGDYLRTHTPAGATLAILGSEPELLFYAHRRSVTGYIYMYDLVEDQPLREKMRREMIDEVEQGKPDLVVFVNLTPSWLPSRPEDFEAIHQWLIPYTERFYEPFGVATFPPTGIFWGTNSFERVPSAARFLWIFKRKESAPLP